MFNDGATASDTYVLEIQSGLYRGVTQELGTGRYLLGSGADADLVLFERDLAPQHVAFVLDQGTIRVEGFADDILLEGAGPVPAGSARTVRLPASVRIGDITFLWREREMAPGAAGSPATGTMAKVRALLGRPAVPGLAAAGILATTVFLTVAYPNAGAAVLLDSSARDALSRLGVAAITDPSAISANSAPRPALAKASPPMPTVPASQAAETPTAPAGRSTPGAAGSHKSSLEAAAAALRQEAAEAGLLNVQITAAGGAVTASGTIEPGMTSRWESLQKGFDENFAGDVTLVNGVAVKTEKLPASLGIEGVWRGAQPYILIRGQRFLVGATVDGGWTIREIERDHVMLERQGRLVAMRF